MNVLAINGSPKIRGTAALLKKAMEGAEKIEGITAELVNLCEYRIAQCEGCNICLKKPCPINDDMEKINEKLLAADGIIIGSPSHFANVTGLLKNFFDRTRYLKMSGMKLKNKILSAVITSGLIHGGSDPVIQAINNFGLIHGMIIVGVAASPVLDPIYPVATLQKERKMFRDITEDEFAMKIAEELGKRVAEIVVKLSK
ncbi:MAG: flavodoxin family protein [Firmicutes bacterium]|jgi:multimeric flavodoxin WrbA|nr:flavodoxin family protein [Bacillota bacterium]